MSDIKQVDLTAPEKKMNKQQIIMFVAGAIAATVGGVMIKQHFDIKNLSYAVGATMSTTDKILDTLSDSGIINNLVKGE